MVGSGIQAFLVKTIFLDGLACNMPVFLRKGETSQNKYSNSHKKEVREQSCEDNVTAIVSWSILSLHVCGYDLSDLDSKRCHVIMLVTGRGP